MSNKKSLENRKTQLKEVNDNIKEKSNKIKELEDSYDKAFDKRMEIENDNNIDEELKVAYREKSAETLRGFIEKGKEASNDLEKEVKKLDDIKKENNEVIQQNERSKKNAEFIDKMASKLNIESNTAEKFESHNNTLNEFGKEIDDAKKNVIALQNSAKNLRRVRNG